LWLNDKIMGGSKSSTPSWPRRGKTSMPARSSLCGEVSQNLMRKSSKQPFAGSWLHSYSDALRCFSANGYLLLIVNQSFS
jgi:hypothetical protein